MHFPEDAGVPVLDGVGAVFGSGTVEKVGGRGLPLFFPEHELGFRYEPAGVPATIEPPTSIPNQIQKRSEPRTQTSPGTQTSTPSLADGRARGD